MTPERWRIITEIFHAALEHQPDRRALYVMEACGQDPSLSADVNALLAGDAGSAAFDDAIAATRITLSPGTFLGPYHVEALLDAGGMGEVYRARDTRLDRQVAIKVLPSVFAHDVQLRQRFEREARAAAALNHPNICALFDIGMHEGAPFIVSELLEGGTLRQVCAAGPMTVRRAIEYAAPIARGLAAAHLKGIVHRDIKPENLFVTTEGRVKILDFGLARLTTAVVVDAHAAAATPTLTEVGIVMGTVGYMSPEQVRGLTADSRSDIFSLGTVLFEMLAGRQPFRGDTSADTASAILGADPPALSAHGVPPELERVIRRCLEKGAPNRFQSADDLAFALEALTLPRTGAAPAPHDGRPRRPALLVSSLLAALAVAVFIVAAAWYANPPRVDPAASRFTPFAIGAASANDAAWSPDGLSIAYARTVNRHRQIFVQGVKSDSAVQITHGINDAERPFWWPDSSRVGYIVAGRVRSISPAGGEPDLVQRIWVVAAALSPDGRTLATWRSDLDANGLHRPFSIWLSTPPNAAPREYRPSPFKVTGWFTPTYLQFSPDGRQLLLSDNTDDGDSAIWLLPLPDGTDQPQRIVPKGRGLGPPSDPTQSSWMPDNRRAVMVFRTPSAPKGGLWMTDVRTGEATVVSAGLMAQHSPSVSPDGSKIVFTAGRPGYDLVEVPLNGAPIRDFLATGSDEYSAAWAPGSSKFVYVTKKNGEEELRVHSQTEDWDRLIVASRAFGEATVLNAPVVSPDGQRVAFDVYGNRGVSAGSIWINAVGGGAPIKLTPGHESENGATWSPDGQSIACFQSEGNALGLAIVRIGTSNPPRILVHGITTVIPAWSPDGEWIAYQTNGDLRLVSPDGARHRVLDAVNMGREMNTNRSWMSAVVWSRDSSTIYSIRRSDDRIMRMVAIDAGTGAVRIVSTYDGDFSFAAPTDPGLRFTLTPDGQSFLATVARSRTDLWILENFAPRGGVLDWFGIRRSR